MCYGYHNLRNWIKGSQHQESWEPVFLLSFQASSISDALQDSQSPCPWTVVLYAGDKWTWKIFKTFYQKLYIIYFDHISSLPQFPQLLPTSLPTQLHGFFFLFLKRGKKEKQQQKKNENR